MSEPIDDAPGPAGQDDADLRAYILSLSNGPAPERPPIEVRDITMVPLAQFVNDPPAQTAAEPVGSPPFAPSTKQLRACDASGSPVLVTVYVA